MESEDAKICEVITKLKGMKTEIHISYNYGGLHLHFEKKCDLPFVPHLGMFLSYGDIEIELRDDSYSKAYVSYDILKQEVSIQIRNYWKAGADPSIVDHVLTLFKDWDQVNTKDAETIKKLLTPT